MLVELAVSNLGVIDRLTLQLPPAGIVPWTFANTWASSAENASTPTPTRMAFAIVPMPGRSCNGIHNMSTTKLVHTITLPSDIPVTSATP